MDSPTSDRNAASRVVTVLEALARADSRGVGVRELAAVTGISRSAVHRVLAQLAELGYASVLPRFRYEAGSLALAWAALLGSDFSLEDAARESLEALAADLDESAWVVRYQPDTDDIVFVWGARATKPVRYRLEPGSRAPLHAGAAGKAVLAQLPDAAVEKLAMVPYTDATITDPALLRADLAAIRGRGYASSEGERIAEAAGFAAPVFRAGTVAGAITVTIPRYRLDAALRERVIPAVVAAAVAVTRLLTPNAPAG